MKAKDLMIGDWVLFDHNPVRVAILGAAQDSLGLAVGDNVFGQPYSMIEPIPLTAEILVKNGFEELVSDGKGVAAMLGRKSEHTRVWMYCIPGTFDSVSYVPERKLLQLKVMEGGIAYLHNLQYVHELQHFLRLFGIEKEITI